MNKILIDTNILIDHMKGKAEASHLLETTILQGNKLYSSIITRIELLTGMREGEDEKIRRFLRFFAETDIVIDIANYAGIYMNKYFKTHGLNTADAIIAATAKHINADLYTLNVKHFPMGDISIIKPY